MTRSPLKLHPFPTQTVLVSFSMPESARMKKPGPAQAAAFSLDQASRKVLLSEAKQVLMEAANTL
jgi:hypothetical protein